MKDSKLGSVLCSVLLALFLLTAALAAAILWRGFYYREVRALSLPERTGYSEEVIREAYDDVMDYLVGDAPFSTGSLRYSESGKSHFADCRVLFQLDFWVLGITSALLLLLLILRLCGKLHLHRFAGRSCAFWALVGILVVGGVLAVIAVLDFERFFAAFHALFFPGKTNWIFDWHTDEIILILPEEFWAHCGILVGCLTLGGGVLLTLLGALFRPGRKKSVYELARK